MTMVRDYIEDSEGRLHSPDSETPAVEHGDGYKAYYKHGELHRTTGPAVVRLNGDNEHWLHGQHIPERVFLSIKERGLDLSNEALVKQASLSERFPAPQP